MSRKQIYCWIVVILIVAQIALLPLVGAEPGGLLNWWVVICLFYLLAPALVLALLVSLPVKWRRHPLWLWMLLEPLVAFVVVAVLVLWPAMAEYEAVMLFIASCILALTHIPVALLLLPVVRRVLC